MRVIELYDKVVESTVYKEWKQSHKNSFLSHFFVQIDSNYNISSNWDLGFFNEDDSKMTVFSVNDAGFVEKKKSDDVFKKAESKVNKLDLEEEILSFAEVAEYSKKAINENFENFSALCGNGFAILQVLPDETDPAQKLVAMWNITFITKKMSFLNVKLVAKNADLILIKEHALMDSGAK